MCALCTVFAGLCVFADLYVCVFCTMSGSSNKCLKQPFALCALCLQTCMVRCVLPLLCVAVVLCCCCVHVCCVVLCAATGVFMCVCCVVRWVLLLLCVAVVMLLCACVLYCVVLCCVLPLVCSCACVVLCAVVLPLLSMLCECVVLRCVLPRAENQKIPLLLRSPVNTQEQSSRFLSFVFRFKFFLHCIIYEMKPLIYL